jgi:hypothetical protein
MKSNFVLALGLLLLLAHCSSVSPKQAPNPGATFANQLSLATNACGPAALINSLRSGDEACQSAAARIAGSNDQKKLRHIILKHGAKPSRSIPGRIRWSRRGINASDLTDVVNELHPAANVTFHHPGSSNTPLLKHSHQLLANSLDQGFPPIVSIRRYANGMPLDSHFLTIIAVDAMPQKHPQQFGFTCVDPAGAKKLSGTVSIDVQQPRLLKTSIPSSSFMKSPHAGANIILMDAMILRK